ncbi:MAG: response regulator [Deltaproteobacteria bacterium]|nr:response regulator [Deltaproteobacteria bacterium]MBN2671555.1 response regulator [Deltaproteobacteria bacterium]
MTKYNALIVEDSQLMRHLLAVSVSRLKDISFDEADDGLAAIKLLSVKQYDIIIADINMPVMDGLKLVKHVRQDARHKDIPVIIVSTEGDADDVQRARQLGVQAYLTKPITGSEITETIEELLRLNR